MQQSASLDDVEQTVTAGGSSLSYDAASDRYTYVWKTDKAWAGQCRQLVLKFPAGSVHAAVQSRLRELSRAQGAGPAAGPTAVRYREKPAPRAQPSARVSPDRERTAPDRERAAPDRERAAPDREDVRRRDD